MIRSKFIQALILVAPLFFLVTEVLGKWEFSEQSLMGFKSELKLLEDEFQESSSVESLEPIIKRINQYGFHNWLDSGDTAERRTREVVSEYNDLLLEFSLNKSANNGLVGNGVSRLLAATDPATLTKDDLERVTENGESMSGIYWTLQSLGLYEGYVENMVAKAFEKSPKNRMNLAVSLGLEVAAPFMLEASLEPFDPSSLTAENSLITTVSEEGDIIQQNQAVYSFIKNGNADSIRRVAEWLLNVDGDYPEIVNALSRRLEEIESWLPKDAMPQFKGLLLSAILAAQPPATLPTSDVEEVAQESTAPELATDNLSELKAPEPTKEPAEESSNWWLWLIGAVVVVGGIGLIARRKK